MAAPPMQSKMSSALLGVLAAALCGMMTGKISLITAANKGGGERGVGAAGGQLQGREGVIEGGAHCGSCRRRRACN